MTSIQHDTTHAECAISEANLREELRAAKDEADDTSNEIYKLQSEIDRLTARLAVAPSRDWLSRVSEGDRSDVIDMLKASTLRGASFAAEILATLDRGDL